MSPIEDVAALIERAGGRAALLGLSSGGALALEAAASGLPVTTVAAYEPPYVGDNARQSATEYEGHLKRLIAAGDRGGAVKYFMTTMVGVPAPMVVILRLMPWIWRKLAAVEVWGVQIGIEALSSDLLAVMDKKSRGIDNVRAMKFMREQGITHRSNFIVNYAYVYIVDQLKRAKGVGDVRVFGSEFGMRVWLRPDRMASLRITAADVAAAIREQNVQAPAGQIGQPPSAPGQSFQYSLRVRGRLVEASEFANIIIGSKPDGSFIRLRDIGRIELGARDYNFTGELDGHPVVAASYDRSVAAGTQSDRNQRKLAKLIHLAHTNRWPLVVVVDGDGARTGDHLPLPPIVVYTRGRFDVYDGLAGDGTPAVTSSSMRRPGMTKPATTVVRAGRGASKYSLQIRFHASVCAASET